jgi:pimeloyl-ACP methyl ester carboxylesterase
MRCPAPRTDRRRNHTRRVAKGTIRVEQVRTYGTPPFRIAVLHGGPGAPGEMAPVARLLAADAGVLEPLQSAASLPGQVEELRSVLEARASLPVALIGFSWGAWLGFILAARYPSLVARLILVGSGSFEEHYAQTVHQTRLARLMDTERNKLSALIDQLGDQGTQDKKAPFGQLGALLSKTDAYDAMPGESDVLDYQVEVYQSILPEAAKLRRTGELLDLGRQIRCPVIAIHGDHDPHLAEGVQIPLARTLENFRFILLERCGHKPWIERQARDYFFEVLREAIRARE